MPHVVLCPWAITQAALCTYIAIHWPCLLHSPMWFCSPFKMPHENDALEASPEIPVWCSYPFPVFAVSGQLLFHAVTTSLFLCLPFLYYEFPKERSYILLCIPASSEKMLWRSIDPIHTWLKFSLVQIIFGTLRKFIRPKNDLEEFYALSSLILFSLSYCLEEMSLQTLLS